MKKIRNLIAEKGSQVWSIGPDARVYDALALMAEKGIGALLVIDDTGPVGLFSERDYTRNVVLKGRSSRETPVREIMTSRVLYVTPDQPVEGVQDDHVMPLLDELLVKAIISEQQFIITQLEHYISS
ncbi:MAG: CBS domain-containing protein [Chromatiaceae bacterium]